MKKLLLFTLFALTTLANAQTIPWADSFALPVILKSDNKLQMPIYHYKLLGKTFAEIEGYIAEIQGKPAGSVKISPDYIEYRFGREVMYRNTFYVNDPKNLELNDEVKTAMAKSDAGTLTKEDLKGPNWIHLVQAIDVEEVNCLAISRKDNKASGCADKWQDGGLTEDKLVCFKGKTYLKCHVECIEKIYKRDVEDTPGSCPEVKPEEEKKPEEEVVVTPGETTDAN